MVSNPLEYTDLHISSSMIEDPWPSRSLRRSMVGLFDNTTETIFFTLPPYSPAAAQQVLGHELHHYALLASTPYGAFIAGLNELRYKHLWTFLQKLTAAPKSPGIRFPLSEWIPMLISKEAIPKSILANFSCFNSMSRLLKILEGAKNISLGELQRFLYLLGTSEEKSIQYFGNPEVVHTNLPVNEDLGAYSPGLACPVFNGVPIGAIHLFEAAAWFYEYIQVGDIAELIDVDLPEELYKTAFALYFDKTRHIFAAADFLPKNPDVAFEYVELVVTFFCAVQLALYPSLHLPVLEAVGTPHSWFDLHPGWRFVRICETIASLVSKVDKDLSNYRELQNQVCEKLQWTPPEKFSKIVSGALDRSINADITGEIDLNFMRMVDLLEVSKDHPWAYIFPVSNYPHAKSAPHEVNARLVINYAPTLISHDFATKAGVKFGRAGNVKTGAYMDSKFVRFVSHYSQNVQAGVYLDKRTRDFVRGHYAICCYITTAFIDWLMFNGTVNMKAFIKASFPTNYETDRAFPFLLKLLEIGFSIFFGSSVRQLRHVRGQTIPLSWKMRFIRLDRYLTEFPFGRTIPYRIPFMVFRRGQVEFS